MSQAPATREEKLGETHVVYSFAKRALHATFDKYEKASTKGRRADLLFGNLKEKRQQLMAAT